MMSQTRRARMVWSPARVALADAAREHAGECHDGLLWIHAGGGRKQRAIGNGEAGDGVDLAIQGAATSRRVSAHPAGAVHVRCEEPELVGLVTLLFYEVEAPLRAHAAAGGVEGQSLCGSGSEVEARGCLQSGYGVLPILGGQVCSGCVRGPFGRSRPNRWRGPCPRPRGRGRSIFPCSGIGPSSACAPPRSRVPLPKGGKGAAVDTLSRTRTPPRRSSETRRRRQTTGLQPRRRSLRRSALGPCSSDETAGTSPYPRSRVPSAAIGSESPRPRRGYYDRRLDNDP